MTEYLKAKLNGTEFELGSKEMFLYIFGEFQNASLNYVNKEGNDLFNTYCQMTLGIRINSIAEIIKQPGFRVNRGPYGNALSGYLKWVKSPNPEVVQILLDMNC